jgi:hypothetical protein
MSNKEKIAGAALATGTASFFSGAFIALGCAYYGLAKRIPDSDYALDLNSAAGKLHISTLILIGVGGLLMLTTMVYMLHTHEEKSEKANLEQNKLEEGAQTLNDGGKQLILN